MPVLTARRLGVDHGALTVLADVSLTVGDGTRLGVVGPNGVGKSTLLQALAGCRPVDRGAVEVTPPGATVGYLAQEQERRRGESVAQHLLRATGVTAADAELNRAAAALAEGGPAAADRYAAALERWTALGVADAEGRIGTALVDAGLDPAIASVPTVGLSGGEAAKVALAAVLLSRFEVLLLDEPTNDLDFAGLARLEAFVTSRSGPVVVVSHDRAFLERTVTDVLELDEHQRSGTWFGGGWLAYLEERATARRHAVEAYESFRDQRSTLQDRARRERSWATSGVKREKTRERDNDKAQRDFRVNRTEQLAARARRTERALERLEEVEKPWEAWELRFEIASGARAGAVVARAEGAVVERGEFRLGPVDLEIGWGERVAITGPNGSGKTTLLQLLLGRLPPSAGRAEIGRSAVVGELGQDRSALATERPLLRTFMDRSGLTVADARTLLAKFGLGADHVDRPSETLSAGERTRAELALFQAREVNLLVLDEPTNHLDLPAIEQLEVALGAFPGTTLLVSHDRRLLDAVRLTRQLRVEAGRVVDVAGGGGGI